MLLEANEPIREGLRKRKKHQVRQPSKPSQTVLWLPEEQLELWEIINFSDKSSEATDKSRKSQSKSAVVSKSTSGKKYLY